MSTSGSTSGIVYRPRRLRTTPRMRRLAAETRLHAADLVLPLFVKEGLTEPAPIASMPGQVQHTEASLRDAVADAARAGLGGVMLFGIPAQRDATGSAGDDPDGVLQRGIRIAREAVAQVEADTGRPGPVVMADTCLDEFTDHGHCGVLTAGPSGEQVVDNDATLDRYASMAVAQARAGAEVVAPSGMMDGQVAVIRDALDDAGFDQVSILAYSAKYASAFYGPFRDAVDSALQGDRRTYQMDAANAREGLREADLDLAEGADMVMVKPAGTSLDVLRGVADRSDVPVAAYQVSGEYAMIEAAAAHGWIDRKGAVLESVTAIKRAGADVVLTYWAPEIAEWIK
ncbi:porphobilinogen synthase [Krasilnikoviella flava]|uniref:Delta-aminolevulinic acid dehydratase n=1 Tax=Krasilnikoviella flava TaxID=526729 RepID=A0A1T5JZ76_9MICO|nr:porphobilinogen synthase [Krasilnikoviella flava]SKC56548.1 porphobilinogen synthase [Krasilnikoviella flava]